MLSGRRMSTARELEFPLENRTPAARTQRDGTLFALAIMAMSSPLALAQAGNVTIPKDASQDAAKPNEKPAEKTDAKPQTGERRIDLRPKFKKGDAHTFLISLRAKTVQQGAKDDADPERTSNQDLTLKMTVVDTTDSGSTLEIVYEAIKLEARSPELEISFDSSKPAAPNDPLQTDSILRPLVGLKLTVQTDKAGRISSVQASGGGGGTTSSPLASGFTSADAVKQMFGPITTMKAGDGFAAVGEAWTNDSSMSGVGGLGTMRITTTNTLRSASGSSAKIAIEGKATLEGSVALPITIKDSAISGSADWNTDRGMLDSMTLTQRIVAESSLIIPDDVMKDDLSPGATQTIVNQVTMTVKRR